MKSVLVALLITTSLTGYAQTTWSSQQIALDDSLNIAILQVPKGRSLSQEITFSSEAGHRSTLTLAHTDSVYTAVHAFESGAKTYKAYITSLPLIQITTSQEIVNEPKILAQISYAHKDTVLTSYAGVELRGSSSLVFPKKTYDLNFYTDSTRSTNKDVKLAGMRSDDDWILDGLYNEPLRMRSYIALNLWNDIYTPHYLDQEPKAKAGASGKYAELFVNNRYQGVFLLQEQVDRKLVKVKKIQGDTIRGEIFQGARYLGASSFDSIAKKKNYLASWGGYDIKYPVPTNNYWDNVYPFTEFVIESTDSVFASGIADQFVIDNAIDYFLFINTLRAPDNLGKNVYLIRYDQDEPYFYAPWDLDGSFGTIFSGNRIDTTDDFLTNGLLRRLIATDASNFIVRFQTRWKELRLDVLSTKTLLKKQRKAYKKLHKNLVFQREALVWDTFIYDAEGLAYMQEWTEKRLAFLDLYIENLK